MVVYMTHLGIEYSFSMGNIGNIFSSSRNTIVCTLFAGTYRTCGMWGTVVQRLARPPQYTTCCLGDGSVSREHDGVNSVGRISLLTALILGQAGVIVTD